MIRAIGRALETDGAAEALELTITSPALARALSSPEVVDAIIAALDSETTDRVWDHLLASDEVQKLVERIAQAPEVRAAIASQGVGLVSRHRPRDPRDRRPHRRRDRARSSRRVRGKRKQPPGPATGRARHARRRRGGRRRRSSTSLFLGVSALLGVTIGGVIGDDDVAVGARDRRRLAAPGSAPARPTSAFFWALAGQTPGMRLLSIRLDAGGKRRIGVRRAIRRLIGSALSVLTLGLGFLLIVTDPRRRSLADRIAGTEVIEDDRELVAPHSVRPAPAPE